MKNTSLIKKKAKTEEQKNHTNLKHPKNVDLIAVVLHGVAPLLSLGSKSQRALITGKTLKAKGWVFKKNWKGPRP